MLSLSLALPFSVPVAIGDPNQTRPVTYVHAGQLFISATPHLAKTVLGSCVAVCLWDDRRGVGGITHYQLPECPADDLQSCRYGDIAIRELVARLETLGGSRLDLAGKVFGGSRVVESSQSDSEHLGTRNIESAFRVLEAEHIRVIAEDVGGRRGRSIGFQTDDGVAWVRTV